MSTFDFPTVRPATVDWQFVTMTQAFPSPFTGSEQTASMPGAARWVATLSFEKLTRLEARALEAFLIRCNGPAGRFYLWNHARENPLGVATGTPLVDGAANYGGLLATRGWPPSVAGILLVGDYIGFNNEVKMVLADVNSDAAGKASISIGPNIRNVPADGAAITIIKPKGIFRLSDDNQAKMQYRKQNGSYQIVCVETWT
jgi:hypothetical protein